MNKSERNCRDEIYKKKKKKKGNYDDFHIISTDEQKFTEQFSFFPYFTRRQSEKMRGKLWDLFATSVSSLFRLRPCLAVTAFELLLMRCWFIIATRKVQPVDIHLARPVTSWSLCRVARKKRRIQLQISLRLTSVCSTCVRSRLDPKFFSDIFKPLTLLWCLKHQL